MATHDPESQKTSKAISRRTFLRSTATVTAAAAGASVMIVPRRVLGQGVTPPSDLVNFAMVGIGGRGSSVAQNLMTQNMVAICDVDFSLLDTTLANWRNSAFPLTGPQTPGSGRGGGGRRGGGAAPPMAAWNDFGPSKAQRDADTRWTPPQPAEVIKRFVSEQIPRIARYRDYREMLEKQKDIDAVVVTTPDHMHAPIAAAAMQLGKHVYVEKPLTWSVHESRRLAELAASTKVVTQMGNQRHSLDSARRGQEYLLAGAIGDVHEVHVWTNRPLAFWPQGVPRPSATATAQSWNNAGLTARLARSMAGSYPVPDTLSWDLFLGVAPYVEYHPVYHPFNWRGWVDWGVGALGDMGAHYMDHPVWGLKLGLPTTIETQSTPFNGESLPAATTTHYEFAARPGMPPVKMTWYDGGLVPARPEEMGDVRMPSGGALYIGSKGKILLDDSGTQSRLLPAEAHNSYGAPPEQLPRISNQAHEMNWINAIRGREEASCPFDYAAHLTEIMLLGIVALRANAKLHYDGAAMRVTNNAAANDYLTRLYRAGYSL